MKKYIEHIQNTRTPHERRQHALQIAGIVTMVLFAGWLATLGMRFNTGPVVEDNRTNTAATLNAEDSQTLLGY